MPKDLDAAVAPILSRPCSADSEASQNDFSETFGGNVGERRANETTLAMYFVTTQMEISSFKIDYGVCPPKHKHKKLLVLQGITDS